MNKIKKIFKSTFAKVTSILLIIAFALSVFFYFDFYKRQIYKVKGYYLVYKGDKAFKKKHFQEAIYFYERAIKFHPKHYKAMCNLANIYVTYEDYHSAIKNYEKALKVKPDYDVARIDYAIILSEIYKTDDAIEQYKNVIETEPKFIKIPFLVDSKKSYKYNRGVAYYNMGLAYKTKSLLAGLNKSASRKYLKKASESYEEAVEILQSYNAHYNLALIYHMLRDTNQAGYHYCKAISISPMEFEAHFNHGVLLAELEQYFAASEEFKRAALLLNIDGSSEQAKYLYDVLSEVNQKISINDKDREYIKKMNDEEIADFKYKAGKLVVFDNKNEEKYIEKFKVCMGKEIFTGSEK